MLAGYRKKDQHLVLPYLLLFRRSLAAHLAGKPFRRLPIRPGDRLDDIRVIRRFVVMPCRYEQRLFVTKAVWQEIFS
jgi:hypothetical protein